MKQSFGVLQGMFTHARVSEMMFARCVTLSATLEVSDVFPVGCGTRNRRPRGSRAHLCGRALRAARKLNRRGQGARGTPEEALQ